MKRSWIPAMTTAAVVLGVVISAQQPPGGGRGGPAPPAGGRGGAPAVQQIPRSPAVDPDAHDRGRAIWASQCIDCHGSQARGGETGPNIIRTRTVNFDRTSFTPGSVVGPFLKAGHPTQSGKASATFTQEEAVALAHFLRQRVNDTMRGSPLFTVGDILVGDRAAGAAYFAGEGKCATCHTATARSLAGIGTRIPAPVDIQQRLLFPGGGGRGRGAPAPTGANAVAISITPSSGAVVSGTLVEQSDFFITVRQTDGTTRTVRKGAGTKIVATHPLQAHIDLLEVISDKQIHDLVAYLESLK